MPMANCRLVSANLSSNLGLTTKAESLDRNLVCLAEPMPIGNWHLAFGNDLAFHRASDQGLADTVFTSCAVARGLLINQLNVKTQRLQLANEYVERLG